MDGRKSIATKVAGGRSLRFIVIGAGLSGILAAIKLVQAGYQDVVVFEKASGPGGTWRDNTYPGIACDIPSHLYCYSFHPNPDWSCQYSPGAEIQAYIEDVVRHYGVERRIRYGEEVTRCEFSEGRWHIETRRGHWDIADVVIAATGVTHHPNVPAIPGLDRFGGALFHSARWNHHVAIDDHRVGVIGTGSTAAQLLSALVPRVSQLSLFQRTAQWVLPQENLVFSAEEKQAFRLYPETMQRKRAGIRRRFIENFADAVIDVSSPQLRMIEDTCREYLETQVRDLALREKLRPDYHVACKRLVMSANFYTAIQQPNARLVTEAIEAIEADGVRTRDGTLHELDVLVLATGFRMDRFMRPAEILGRDGQRLDDYWAGRPSAYLCVAIPGFPNFFMLNGPNGPVGNFPLIEVAELQMDYILQLIGRLRAGECREISPRESTTASFDAARIEAAKKTVWVSGCRSWYLDDRGVPAAWPWSIEQFKRDLQEPKMEAYELVS